MYIDLQKAIDRIIDLHKLMEQCLHLNKKDEAMCYFRELRVEIEEFRKYFGIPVYTSIFQNNQSKTIEEINRKIITTLNKMKAAVRMGREDIAERYLEELTEEYTIYFSEFSACFINSQK
jgi:hypothetical protein